MTFHSLLLLLTFGVFGLLLGGLMIVLSVRVPKRFFTAEFDLGWRRGPLFLGGVMFVVGVIALVVPPVWLELLSETDEYPVGRAQSLITTQNGLRVVATNVGARLQVYDAEWNFLRGWDFDSHAGSNVALRPLANDEFEVLTLKGSRRYAYNTNGELISTGTYPWEEFATSSGKSAVVPTPWWLWVFTSHEYWMVLCAGGFALFALACWGGKRGREKLAGNRFGHPAANHRLKLTGAAILVFRASTSLRAAPAA